MEEGAMDLQGRAQLEVIDLHQFFEDWFLDRENADFSRVERALAADFEMITPAGQIVERAAVLESLKGALGRWNNSPEKIEIRKISPLLLAGGWILVRYEEWHLPSLGEPEGRISTASFRSNSEAPLGLEWVRLHETWLPAE